MRNWRKSSTTFCSCSASLKACFSSLFRRLVKFLTLVAHPGKDIFEAYYKRDLAKRLLLNKSASFDAERSMLLKLKDGKSFEPFNLTQKSKLTFPSPFIECGPGFTAKLEIMFKDIELSADIMTAYTTTTSKDAFDLSVNILSMGNWPSYPPVNVRIPDDMTRSLDKFKAFYVGKHSGRSLKWQHSLDYCSLRAHFPKGGRKELVVSLFQTLVLLLFNKVLAGAKLSFAEIVEATNLGECPAFIPPLCRKLSPNFELHLHLTKDAAEAGRTLQSLACGKVRVLQKHPKGREVAPTDQFTFNSDFKDDHIKIKINQIQQKETVSAFVPSLDDIFSLIFWLSGWIALGRGEQINERQSFYG